MTETEILAALRTVNTERCRPPLDGREVERVAKSVARYEPTAVPWRQNRQTARGGEPRFSARPLERERMRSPRWAWEGYILAGSLNGLVGPAEPARGRLWPG